MITHRTYRTLAALICCLLLVTLGVLPIGAEDDLLQQNRTAVTAATEALDEQITYYDGKENAETKLPADKTISVITAYQAEIRNLVYSNMQAARDTDLRADISLLRTKGEIAAQLTWIAYLHGVIEEEAPSDIVWEQYARLVATVDEASEGTTLAELANNACIVMNQTVFKQKINRLPQELSVAEVYVLDHLKQARIQIDATLSPDIDGEAYFGIYRQTRELIVLEQGRLAAKQELSEVYDLLGLPSADKLSVLGTLAGVLADATSTEQINAQLLQAAYKCLQTALPDTGRHTKKYQDDLYAAMSEAVADAGDRAVARLVPYFNGTHASFPAPAFSLRAEIALAKDRIESLCSPDDEPMLLSGIVGDYVSAGGILDLCESRETLDYEVLRASHRIEWARKKPFYLSKIEQILPTASADFLHLRIKAIYDEIDAAIVALPMGSDAANALITDGIGRLEDVVCEAEAEHFRISHADVLTKTGFADVTLASLETAIEAFDRLSAPTQAKLATEKTLLGEHYKSYVSHTISRYLNEDGTALRQQVFSTLLARVTALSAADARPSALRAEADEALARAEASDALLDRYAQVCASPHYAQYDSDSVALLQRNVQMAVDMILDPTQTSVPATGGLKTVDSVLRTQLLEMERRVAIAELRLAADGSDLENVKALLLSATDSILLASNEHAVGEIRAATIFRIGAYRKADQMRRELEELNAAILDLRALSDEQKQTILNSEQMQALLLACTQAENALNSDALSSLAASFATEKQRLLVQAEERALLVGIETALQETTTLGENIRAQITGFAHLTNNERASYVDRLETVLSQWKAGMQTPSVTWELLDAQLLEIQESLKGILASAKEAEQAAFRVAILAAWQEKHEKPEAYSESNYASILALINEGQELLKNATEIEGIKSVQASIEERLSAIPTRLDEAKSQALESIQSTYNILQNKKLSYSSAAWGSIEETYESSKQKIAALSLLSDVDSVLNIATDACRQMQETRRSHLYTSEDHTLAEKYPADYQPSSSGYWGGISSPDAIPTDAKLSIMHIDASSLADTWQHILRNQALVDAAGQTLSSAQLSLLKDGVLQNGLAISFTAAESPSLSSYLISILLPNDYDVDDILGIVFITDENNAEFYNIEISGNVISFETSHISDFYIVSKKTIDLSALILVLAIILLCEIAAILLILAKRKEKSSTEHVAAWMPLVPFAASVRITPQGGLVAVIILSVCITVATAALIWLILDERARRPLISTTEPAALDVPQKETTDLVLAEKASEPEVHAPIESSSLYEPLPTVTAELANAMMSDEAVLRVKESNARYGAAPQACASTKKHAVNIDVISKSFEPYDTVSLAALKKRGLVPPGAKAIKILARGTLDKPLTVIANDFSATAIKMILLTGGEVINAE